MFRQTSITRGLVLAVLTFASCLTTPGTLRGSDEDANKLDGTWALTVPGTPFRINRTFFSNGTNVDASSFTPITQTPGALIDTDGHGAWTKTGPGQYAVTLLFFQLNPATGALNTYGKVRESVVINGDSYRGTFKTDIFLPNGTPIIHVGGTTEGHRIPVQPAS